MAIIQEHADLQEAEASRNTYRDSSSSFFSQVHILIDKAFYSYGAIQHRCGLVGYAAFLHG